MFLNLRHYLLWNLIFYYSLYLFIYFLKDHPPQTAYASGPTKKWICLWVWGKNRPKGRLDVLYNFEKVGKTFQVNRTVLHVEAAQSLKPWRAQRRRSTVPRVLLGNLSGLVSMGLLLLLCCYCFCLFCFASAIEKFLHLTVEDSKHLPVFPGEVTRQNTHCHINLNLRWTMNNVYI